MSRDRDDWVALSRQVLLHQVTHGDAAHALALLRRHLRGGGRGICCIGWLGVG
jgi:hypothetical protein